MRRAMVAIAMLAISGFGCTGLYLLGNIPLPSGILIQPYSTMTGSQFDTLVGTIDWKNGHTRDRCTDNPCSVTVPVTIDANASSYTIDSLNPGVEGILVARVRNTGGDTTFMYHFKPPPYRYYFLVKRPVGGPTRWVLLEKVPGSPSHPDSVNTGPFTGCWDHPAATEARADFRDCGMRTSSALQSPRVTALTTSTEPPMAPRASLTRAMLEVGGWIGCAYGCCPLGSPLY